MRRIPSVDALGRAYATGRRKTAVARVWLTAGTGNVTVNRKMMVCIFTLNIICICGCVHVLIVCHSLFACL